MTPTELQRIVTAWGGQAKTAAILGVHERTIRNWLSGTHRIPEATAKLIRLLEVKDNAPQA